MWQSLRFVGLHQLTQTASFSGAIMLAALLWFTASLSANDGPPHNDGQSATELPRTTSPSAAPNPQQVAEQTLARERQLLDLLARPVSLDYQNMPLEKLLDDLAQRCGTSIYLDREAAVLIVKVFSCSDQAGSGCQWV